MNILKLKSALFGLFTLVAIVFSYADDEPSYSLTTIPKNNFPMVDAEINGKQVKIFLDTGNPDINKVWKETAKRIGIPSEGGKFDVKIGDIVIQNVPIKVDTFDNGYSRFGMDAFFGAPFISRFYLICDYPSSRLLLVPRNKDTNYEKTSKLAKEKIGDVENSMVIPFINPTGHIMIETSINNIKEKLHFGVDTGGMSNNCFTSLGIKTFGISFTGKATIAGTNTTIGTTIVDELSLGEYKFKKVAFVDIKNPSLEGSVEPFKKKGVSLGGLIGVEFLRSYRIGIDYGEKKLYMYVPKGKK